MSPIPVQDVEASTALAQGFGLRGKISLSMDEVIVPVALVRDFTGLLDREPSTIHVSTDLSFGINTNAVGANYKVPLERRAIIDYVQMSVTLNDEILPGGRMDLQLRFTLAGLASTVGIFATLGPGYGFGNYPFLKVASGSMNPDDRWSVELVITPNTPSGRLTSVLHGTEFNESP